MTNDAPREQGVTTPPAHPCPTPTISRKGGGDGNLWACTCGKVYVCRHWWNYAGEGWEWKPTGLRVDDGSQT